MTPERRANLSRLLSPRHIAFVGGRDCVIAIREAERRGFAGQIWPVNPQRPEMAGYRCFASVDDLPEAPDAVFLAVPAPAAVEVVARLGSRGAGGIVCYAAGFREAGPEGSRLEQALVAASGEMAVIGPNCYGAINYLSNTALWPFAHGGVSSGFGAAIVTQSGMFSSDITMSQRGLPLTHMISCGNQAVLSLEDFADFLIDEPGVRALGLHIEGLRNVARFHEVALRAVEKNIPLVVLKTGSSSIGASLTVSHTGSLSGADDLYNALFERVGAIRVRTPSEFLETLKLLTITGVPEGSNVAGFTCSGGGATMLADHAETIGLCFPSFDPQAKAELATLLPPIASVSNPLDYTTPIWGDAEKTRPVFAAAMNHADAAVAVLVQDYPAAGLDESLPYYRADAGAFVSAARERKIPAAVVATLHENLGPATRDWLAAEGVAPMQGLAECLNAIRDAIWWSARRSEIAAARPAPLQVLSYTGALIARDEAEGKARLRSWGLPVPEGRLVSGAELPDAANHVGYPVVLKMMGERLAHKSEAGAVAVGIGNEAALVEALSRMRLSVAAHDPKAVTDQFLVEQMTPKPVAELFLSLRSDPDFGQVLTIGAGGVFVEILKDSVTLLLPAPVEAIADALGRLKIAPVLKGFRGAASADRDAIIRVIADLAERMAANPSIAEIEINPLFVAPAPHGVTIVDVLIHDRHD